MSLKLSLNTSEKLVRSVTAGAAVCSSAVVDAITAHRFRWSSEDDLQAGLAGAIAAAGFPLEREVRLSGRDRIDLLVDRVGVEVKIAGSSSSVRRQLVRYAESGLVDELVLVTTRSAHSALGGLVGDGVPLCVVYLGGAGL